MDEGAFACAFWEICGDDVLGRGGGEGGGQPLGWGGVKSIKETWEVGGEGGGGGPINGIELPAATAARMPAQQLPAAARSPLRPSASKGTSFLVRSVPTGSSISLRESLRWVRPPVPS